MSLTAKQNTPSEIIITGTEENKKEYWLNKLSGLTPLHLPVDFKNQYQQASKRVWVSQKLNAALSNKIKAISEKEGVTTFVTLLAGCKLLLKNYCDEENICISTLYFNKQIGNKDFIVDVLPVITNIHDDINFTSLVQLVRKNVNEAHDNMLPDLSSIIQKASTADAENQQAPFQVMFITDNDAHNNIIEFYHKSLSQNQAFPQLSFFVKEISGQFQVSIEYSRDLFEPQTISRIIDHYEQLLSSAVAEPQVNSNGLAMLNNQETSQLLNEFNNTAAPYPKDKTLINLFEEQVSLHANEPALIFRNNKCTFNDLNIKANQLADYLKTNYEIDTEDLVAVKLQRSEWMIIAVLAVLKAGAAYVPVDPGLNESRIKYMIEDSKCKVVIDDTELEKFKAVSKRYSYKNPPQTNTARSLAYVIYTSGSTGNPKGVMVEHRGVVNRIEWMWNKYQFSARDVIMQKTTFTFDVSVWEIFTPLCWGCKMVLCHKDDIASPQNILKLINTHKVTCIHFVPGMFNAFLSSVAAEPDFKKKVSSLRCVVTSGEALLPETVKKWYGRVNIPVYNFYGPTEASIEVTYYETSKQDKKVPIGKPINNIKMYILNKHQKLVPSGVMGEICIGGDGVARGYLNRPALTAEKFVTDPFVKEGTMYKTGDYGRWLGSGNIEYLGRKDEQVKIRGYRIELTEIENAISRWKQVAEAAVITKADEEGDKYLVAYVVLKESLDKPALQNFLKTLLPEYMIPSVYYQTDVLPLNANGKVDKKVLLSLQAEKKSQQAIFKEPSTETEKTIAAVWKDVLKINKVSILDNFFDIGGHSLIAIKLMGILEKETHVRLPLAILFESPTIEQLAQRIDNKQLQEWECLVPIRPSGSKPPVYIVHGAGGHVLILNYIATFLHSEQPIYGFQPKGVGVNTTIPKTVEELAAVYVAELLQQNPAGPYALAGFSFGGVIAFEMAQQLKAIGKEVKVLALFDSYLGEKYHDAPASVKIRKKISFEIMKKINTITSLITGRDRRAKIDFEKRKLKEQGIKIYQKLSWLFRKKGTKRSHMYYIYKIREQFDISWRKYNPKLYNGDVELFRATKKTFYYHDYEYLGWRPFIKGKINVHEINAEHETIFRPPNNKKFAKELQAILDIAFFNQT